MARRVPRTPIAITIAALLAGVLLGLALVQGNELWLPAALQPIGHTLYRLAYWITLPAQRLVLLIYPLAHHHVPDQNPPAAAAVTAVALGLLAWGAVKLWRHLPLPSAEPEQPGRRDALATIGTGLLGAGVLSAIGFGTWGVLIEPRRLQVRRYSMPIRGLPAWADGLRIVQLSDTHYGPYVPLTYLRRAVDLANSLEPDLIALTGDYVHRTVNAIPDGIGVLGTTEAPLGRFSVLGNHDHWAGPEACLEALRANGVRPLDRQHVYLGPDGAHDEPGPDRFVLAGFGDLWEDEHPAAASLQGVDPDTPRVVLSHNPDYAEYLPEDLRVDLIIAGHTHGGQVWVPGKGTPKIPSRYGQWYAGGICKGPHCPVIVSRGVGMAYLPVRLGVPPEIVVITLTRAPEPA